MKNGIKIAIIAVVTIILVVVVVLSIKDLSGGGDRTMAVTPFEKTVEEKIKTGIEGKDYTSARAGFNSVMNYIDTETSIRLADGNNNITPEEAAKAKAMVFEVYAPMVIERGNQIFGASSWVTSEVTALGEEASKLAKSGGDATLTGDLNNIVNTANAYKEALGVIASAKNCSTVGAVSSLVAKANNFKRSPLTNNVSLMASLDEVGSTARSAVANSLYNKAAGLKKKATSYSSWSSFLSNYESVSKSLDAYINAFGQNNKIAEAYAVISSAYSIAYDHYNYNYYYDPYSGYDY